MGAGWQRWWRAAVVLPPYPFDEPAEGSAWVAVMEDAAADAHRWWDTQFALYFDPADWKL